MRPPSGIIAALRAIASLMIVLLVVSCDTHGATPGAETAGSGTIVFRGYARYTDEVREFVPCDSARPYWVVDSSQALWTPYRELASDPADTNGLFAVIEGHVGAAPAEGFGAGDAGTLVVTRPLYVAREGYGCAAPWDRFAYRAFGNEPFWSLTVAGDSLMLVRPGEPEQVWHGTRDTASAALAMTAGDPATDGITLLLRPGPCRDTMAGSYLGYVATVRLGGDSLTGCALRGGAP
jgi:putative lipoprotein